ncbi:MAG: AI-2E family transporter, partial [Actinomycetota bacterium]|nr:AI-2E family transporter [Actinomycetota bacterium]
PAPAVPRPGPALDRRSPFWVGLSATFGVAVATLVIVTVYYARNILLLLGLSLFVAAGLDPVVAWLHRRMPRPLAVLIVIAGGLALAAGFGDLVVPVLVHQVAHLVKALPRYFAELPSNSSFVGRLNSRYHVEKAVRSALTQRSSTVASGLLGIGRAVLGAVASSLVVAVVSTYLLFELPRFKRLVYGLAPRSRRARTVLLGDQIFAKVGGYVLGKLVTSIVTGVGTYIWCAVLGVPYPLLLAVLVAVFDLVPAVGSTVGGVVVAAVSLTVSLPVAVATVAFYLVYRLVEDYLLIPRIMRRTIDVPGLVTVIATLVGWVLLGVIGALVAIPVAAAVKLLLEELAAPRLEQS